MSTPDPTPTVVLVHGAFVDASSWNGVIAGLKAAGLDVVAPPNLLRGVGTDAAYLTGFVAALGRPVVLAGHSYAGGSGGSPRVRTYISATSPARSARPSPPVKAARSCSSAVSRCSGGSLPVHRQISRPADSGTCPAASAAIIRGWVVTRLAQAVCPAAAPRVMPVRWISQDTAL